MFVVRAHDVVSTSVRIARVELGSLRVFRSKFLFRYAGGVPLILTEYPREASLKLTSLARARCVLKKIDQPVLCTAPRAYVNRPREIAEETERSRRRINDLQAERDALGIVG